MRPQDLTVRAREPLAHGESTMQPAQELTLRIPAAGLVLPLASCAAVTVRAAEPTIDGVYFIDDAANTFELFY
jgi:hypothetical protein